MIYDERLRNANSLILRWHTNAATVRFEAFVSWSLALFKPRLRFDGVVWGLISQVGSAGGSRLGSAKVQGLSDVVLKTFERARAYELSDSRPLGEVVSVCMADARWQGDAHSAIREHAKLHGLANTLFLRLADAGSLSQQFIMLSRNQADDRFTNEEVADFEFLAPHLMQAYATRRRSFLDLSLVGGTRGTRHGHTVAMVDQSGNVHDHHADFVTMLQREWSDWQGKQLPDPLPDLVARRSGTSWRFLGSQVSAEFVPVDDIYLVTARPRHRVDVLSSREGEVAHRYAAGNNFREIAESLHLAPTTVRAHLRNVYGKLDISNKTQLAAFLR